jgi:hypothetical protein
VSDRNRQQERSSPEYKARDPPPNQLGITKSGENLHEALLAMLAPLCRRVNGTSVTALGTFIAHMRLVGIDSHLSKTRRMVHLLGHDAQKTNTSR